MLEIFALGVGTLVAGMALLLIGLALWKFTGVGEGVAYLGLLVAAISICPFLFAAIGWVASFIAPEYFK